LKVTRKKNELFGKDIKPVEKSKNKLKKLARKGQEEKEKAQQDTAIEISMDQNLTLNSTSQLEAKSTSSPKSESISSTEIIAADDDSDSDANSELDVQEAAILKTKVDANPKGLKAFQQRDLVALAFAGDNVVHVRDP
jgi:U3 small nucleolar RNA-associated protein 14